MPSFGSAIYGDAVIDEEASNGVLDPIDAPVESLSIFDQGAEFTVFGSWHVNGFEFVHRGHASEFEVVIWYTDLLNIARGLGSTKCRLGR